MSVPYLACMVLVASIYHLPPRVLPAIQAVEGGFNDSIRHDVNGSDDFGVMQVNSLWIPAFSRLTGLAPAAVRLKLISQPCFNVAAAGAILKTYLDETQGNLMVAIGNYHSHTPALNEVYQLQVMGAARDMFERVR